MDTIEGFITFVDFIDFWTREQAQSKVSKHAEWTTNVMNGHYKLASPSTKQMVSSKINVTNANARSIKVEPIA